MFKLHQFGRLPLTLKPFTEDRTLGLKAFAWESLRLTSIYFTISILVGLMFIFEGFLGIQYLLLFLAYFLLGLVLFFLPLRALHDKLRDYKRDRLRWIGERYTRAVGEFESNTNSASRGNVDELVAIDKIQRDIQLIRTWPFDVGILARLVAVILSVTAIITSRIVTLLLGI